MKQILFFLLYFPFLLNAQDFSKEDYIFLDRHDKISISLTNGNFDITKNVQEKSKFITAKKLYFANESIHFDSFSEIKDIEAYTFIPESNKKIEVDYIETKREFDNGIFYSDQESKNFTFPAVNKGAETYLNYLKVVKDPHFMDLFRFGTYVPTKSAKLTVEFPKNVTLGYIVFHTEDIEVTLTKEETRKNNIYTWSAQNVKGFQSEENSEEPLHFMPHIITYIKSYEEKGKQINVLNDVSDLYKWYTSLVDRIDVKNLNKVYSIAEDITRDLTTKKEKAETIFNWVQDNITYVAFEDGLGGFIPRGAASVCDKRYGDCKDMANLLYEMLNHVGIETYRTWIGTRNRPYSYYEVPTPIVDNHMISAAIVENDTIFLDATDSFVPFGFPSAFTQTKEALLGINNETFKVVTVPTPESNKSITSVLSEISLVDGTIMVKEKRKLTGYEKVDYNEKYTYEKDDKTEEEFLNTILVLGNNKTQYNNITHKNLDNKSNPLELTYDLTIDNYSKTVGNKTFINLNLDRVLSKSKIDIEDRKYSRKIDYKHQKEYVTTFNIPEGYTVANVPKALEFTHPDFGYSISYTLEDNKVIQYKTIKINTLSIKKERFEDWNAFIKSLIKAYKKSITLEKIS
mgnify:FL=1